jgi:homoserine dehydrogenase
VLSDIAALRYGYGYEYKKARERQDLNFTNNIELNVYLRYDDEQLVEDLGFLHIQERYYSGNFKFVIGKINLQNLIASQHRISESKAFIAFADQLAGVSLASA